MKRIFPALTAAVLLLATTVLAQQDQGTSPKAVQHLNRAPVNRGILQIKPPRPIETKLPNGLTVLLLERHQVPMVNVELWVHTGSLDDPKDRSGQIYCGHVARRYGTPQQFAVIFAVIFGNRRAGSDPQG